MFATIFGTVQGTVHDPDHRPIAGATVTVKAATSDWSRTTKSDENGEFRIEAVPVGDYIVTVSRTGFTTLEQKITVISDSSPVLHFPLEIASVNQKVTVTAEAETANVESVTPTTLVDRNDVARTPGADRTNSLQMITDYVPGAYLTHDQLHIRGGHQVSWLIDGVPIPNTNIASNLGPQIDPKDIDYLEVMRGSYDAEYGDRTYGVFNVVPRTGWERNSEADIVSSFGNLGQTNDELNFGGHTERFAYFGSVNGNRSDLGLETPVSQVLHDAENGYGAFASLIFSADPKDQLRLVTSLRRDYYQIPYDPNPNDSENQQFDTSGLRDGQHEADAVVDFSWVRTIRSNMLLTVSPFYHYNNADYAGAPNDFPVSTTDNRASRYAGGQATFGVSAAKNDAQFGLYGFNAEADASGRNDTALRKTAKRRGQLSRSRMKSGTERRARRYSESLQTSRHAFARLAYSTANWRECSSAPELRTSEVIWSGCTVANPFSRSTVATSSRPLGCPSWPAPFCRAKIKGSVTLPSFKSLSTGFPSFSDDAVKSSRSSTS